MPPVESDFDIAAFTNPEEFGVVAVCTKANGTVIDGVVGIFDEPSTLERPGIANTSQSMFATQASNIRDTFPRFITPSSAVQSLAKDDLVLIDGVGDFQIDDIQKDGTFTVLILRQVMP